MTMRTLVSLGLALTLFAGVAPVAADHPGNARPRDLRVLQDELNSLDYAIERLDAHRPPHRDTAALRARADSVRAEVTAMRGRVRRDAQGQGIGVPLEDVTRMRAEIADLRGDIEAAIDLGYVGDSASLPAGTEMFIRLDETISSKTARPEDRVRATIAEPVRLDGRTVIPVGTEVTGFIRTVDTADRLSRGGKLELVFDTLRLDNSRMTMRTRLVEVRESMDRSDTGRKAGLGAILGGVLGGIVEGRSGAIIGAILGAGGGVAATKGEDVVLPEGTVLTIRLDEAMAVTRR